MTGFMWFRFADFKRYVRALFILATIAVSGSFSANLAQANLLNALPQLEEQELRLVMVAIEGCPFCMRFDQQVGVDYPKSPEAKRAPLLRVRFGSESLAHFKEIKFTPTFLLVQGNVEVGRIAGYPGRDAFWEELNALLNGQGAGDRSKAGTEP